MDANLYEKDFGVWNITYEAITCAEWNGWNDQAALGSAPNMFPGVCCPAEPSVCDLHLFFYRNSDLVVLGKQYLSNWWASARHNN